MSENEYIAQGAMDHAANHDIAPKWPGRDVLGQRDSHEPSATEWPATHRATPTQPSQLQKEKHELKRIRGRMKNRRSREALEALVEKYGEGRLDAEFARQLEIKYGHEISCTRNRLQKRRMARERSREARERTWLKKEKPGEARTTAIEGDLAEGEDNPRAAVVDEDMQGQPAYPLQWIPPVDVYTPIPNQLGQCGIPPGWKSEDLTLSDYELPNAAQESLLLVAADADRVSCITTSHLLPMDSQLQNQPTCGPESTQQSDDVTYTAPLACGPPDQLVPECSIMQPCNLSAAGEFSLSNFYHYSSELYRPLCFSAWDMPYWVRDPDPSPGDLSLRMENFSSPPLGQSVGWVEPFWPLAATLTRAVQQPLFTLFPEETL